MNEIKIKNENGILTVSSLQIARDFGKQHKHVLESIEHIKAEISALTPMFAKSKHKTETVKVYKIIYENSKLSFHESAIHNAL